MEIVLRDHASLDGATWERLARETHDHTSLEQVLLWAAGRQPVLRIQQIVTQDEYTHDVVLPFEQGLFLVYDTT